MIQTTNPFTGKVEQTFPEMTPAQLRAAIDRSHAAYLSWRHTPLPERAARLRCAAQVLRERGPELAKLATREMGKLLREARDWELPVCADIAEYYADHAAEFLAPRAIAVAEGEAQVVSEPIGVLLGVMPWNFPYYQVLRFAAPNLVAGNVCLVKHASNVPQVARALEDVFREAGLPEGAYTNLPISSRQVAAVLDDPRVRGVSLTGSERAGSLVAEQAGRRLKKAVLELGGSDPFIVLEDADLDQAVQVALEGKMFNSGQCCAAAKRFILLEPIAETFLARFTERLAALRPGDPLSEATTLAPLVSEEAANEILDLVGQSVALGAKLRLGGDRPALPGAFVNPTILTDIPAGSPAYAREIFGPVACVFVAKDEEEAIAIANDSEFGLGSAICTRDLARARRIAERLEAGMVYINTYTISRPELPFGGIKNSGFGRELSNLGIAEFLNHKLIRCLRN